MECFYEQFQTREYEVIESKLKKASMIILILAAISLITLFFEFTILFIVIYITLFFLRRKIIVEYEYELTSYDMSIYKIMNKSKRKEMVSFNIRDISSVKKADINNLKDKSIVNLCLDDINIEKDIVKVKTTKGFMVLKLAMDDKLIGFIKRVNPLAFY
ncbi:hypothetical protein [Clostridium sp.]|uniref:hypothetical protein n=1 Tax=Clostridium sp. TaxID=1506 RepID=UPI002611F081|nr:hypothetical protein [Clostridium sp.]